MWTLVEAALWLRFLKDLAEPTEHNQQNSYKGKRSCYSPFIKRENRPSASMSAWYRS